MAWGFDLPQRTPLNQPVYLSTSTCPRAFESDPDRFMTGEMNTHAKNNTNIRLQRTNALPGIEMDKFHLEIMTKTIGRNAYCLYAIRRCLFPDKTGKITCDKKY